MITQFQSAPRERGESMVPRPNPELLTCFNPRPASGAKEEFFSDPEHNEVSFNPRPASGAKETGSPLQPPAVRGFNPRPASGAKVKSNALLWSPSLFQSAPRERGESLDREILRYQRLRFNPRPASGAKA